MAIKMRRGNYADFDPTKMDEGEIAVVQRDDPNTDDGKAVYLAFTPGNVKRIATTEDIQTEVAVATQQIVQDVSSGIKSEVADDVNLAQTAATNAQTAATEAATEASEAAASATQAAQTVANIIDNTLAQTGKAADAKVVGDELADLKSDLEQIVPGLSDEAKEALLACFAHVAWIDDDGQDYYDALEDALYEESYRDYIYPSNDAVYMSANVRRSDVTTKIAEAVASNQWVVYGEKTGTTPLVTGFYGIPVPGNANCITPIFDSLPGNNPYLICLLCHIENGNYIIDKYGANITASGTKQILNEGTTHVILQIKGNTTISPIAIRATFSHEEVS